MKNETNGGKTTFLAAGMRIVNFATQLYRITDKQKETYIQTKKLRAASPKE